MNAIAAIDEKRGLAKQGSIPWSRPRDLRWFRGMTYGHPVIVGRDTFESMPPLNGRMTHVLTNRPDSLPDDVHAFDGDIRPDAIVIGGRDTYRHFWDQIETFFLTVIDGDYDCDLHLPKMDPEIWTREKLYTVDDMTMWELTRIGYR